MSLRSLVHKFLIWPLLGNQLWSSRTSCITISVSSAWRDPAEPTCWCWQQASCPASLPTLALFHPPSWLRSHTLVHCPGLNCSIMVIAHVLHTLLAILHNAEEAVFLKNLPVLRVEDEIKQLQKFSNLAPGRSKHADLILTLGRNPVGVWNSRAFVTCTRSSDCWRSVLDSNRAEL